MSLDRLLQNPLLQNQLLRFAIVGAIGFVVDTAVLYAMLGLSLDFMPARFVSFLAAAYSTWLINRRFTFKPTGHDRWWTEWGKYLLAMSGGGAVNLLAYHAVMSSVPRTAWTPMLAVAVGSVAGLTVNFVAAKLWVYRARS